MSEPQHEPDEDRMARLLERPESADINDVRWLAMRCDHQQATVDLLKKGAGRFFGLKEAAELVEAASRKDVLIRFMAGKREATARAINTKLLLNVATIIRRYSDDAEHERGGFARKEPVAP